VGRLAFTAAACAVFVAGMVGMSFAAVPLYRIFCQLTGYGGTTQRAEVAPGASVDRVVRVRFDSNIGNGLGWSFRPLEREIRVKVGAVAEVKFLAENRGTTAVSGTAAFNVTPGEAGAYFTKISCFCFSEQTLAPGERRELPVVFFVDPSMVQDRNLDVVDTITLSYTFYPSEPSTPPRPLAAAEPGPADGQL
jgi:cytochrome c oxidase assembly protein subunit 11